MILSEMVQIDGITKCRVVLPHGLHAERQEAFHSVLACRISTAMLSSSIWSSDGMLFVPDDPCISHDSYRSQDVREFTIYRCRTTVYSIEALPRS